MAVYIDDMNAPYGRMRMSHMLADSTEELLAMADAIGVDRRWLQKAGTSHEHFDVAKVKKDLAISKGAVLVSVRELGALLIRKRLEAPKKEAK
jgi:hypothetical protein